MKSNHQNYWSLHGVISRGRCKPQKGWLTRTKQQQQGKDIHLQPRGGGGGALDFHVDGGGGAAGGRKPDPVAMRSVNKKYTLSQYTLQKQHSYAYNNKSQNWHSRTTKGTVYVAPLFAVIKSKNKKQTQYGNIVDEAR